ncbi:ADP-ribosylglycohydrolase family protein [Geoalkalibacter halelectricus]|uniref:ADP-ribosylglycohydrolase family protein n=2 Tax=Geoalkalibacter halelectricus TaxID=2847045 RepID=A0ABY5ZQN7_9BACT|nr:ADP-ribosylglycohydrolase family protein [Geoalkalibacter halelectricus]UWZ79536.1 ADP-ribosylglycohydrolase family protein [Geoalkalibacter halelectricus]
MLIGRLVEGDDLEPALDKTYEVLEQYHYADETMAAIDKARQLAADLNASPCQETIEGLGEGWTGEEALAIAVYCSLVAKGNFDFGVRLAVNHGGDSDSTGAIAGKILGAMLGRKGIGEQWLMPLELRDIIEQVATDLIIGYRKGRDWWTRYPGY